MIGRLAIRPRAVRDIDEQAAYLARHASEAVAVRFLGVLAEVMLRIMEMPELGPKWESDVPALRDLQFWIPKKFKNHMVFYRVAGDCIEIVRVLHGARDLERYLQEPEN